DQLRDPRADVPVAGSRRAAGRPGVAGRPDAVRAHRPGTHGAVPRHRGRGHDRDRPGRRGRPAPRISPPPPAPRPAPRPGPPRRLPRSPPRQRRTPQQPPAASPVWGSPTPAPGDPPGSLMIMVIWLVGGGRTNPKPAASAWFP